MTCPLCGHRFEKSAAHCSTCPLSRSCNVLCCPHCRYQFPGESATMTFLKRLFRGRKAASGGTR